MCNLYSLTKGQAAIRDWFRDALALQRPVPSDALSIVARGEKEDRSPEAGL
jgi:hypothetical protein